MKRVVAPIALAWALLAVPSCAPATHDTGYVGSWRRSAAAGESAISLREVAGEMRFRWRVEDGERRIACDDAGLCEEFLGPDKRYEYRFRVFRQEASPHLFVECVGRGGTAAVGDAPSEPDAGLQYVDRLELRPGGRELWAYTVEQDGRAVPGAVEPLRFVKVSDTPF